MNAGKRGPFGGNVWIALVLAAGIFVGAARHHENPAAKGNKRVVAVVLCPWDAQQITIPEPKK